MGRLRDRALYAIGDALLWRSCLPGMNRARRAVGLEPIDHPLDQIRRADRVLVQTSPWFDFNAHAREGNVRYVGPEIDDPTWVEPLALPFAPDNRDPLILIAFSTTFMGHVKVLHRIIAALSDLSVRAIVTTGPAVDPKELPAPPHIVVCASAPHGELLSRAALVVTHAGHGTAIRALAKGVPVLALPMGRDQADNAVRIVAAHAGVRLSPRARTGAIRRAIGDALRDRSLADGAARAKEILVRERSGDPAVEELESLLGKSRRSSSSDA
jgi:MGT family glycosyltransferase